MSKIKDILLLGGGGHCKSCIDVIELEGKYNIVGIIDKKELIDQDILGYKVIGCDDNLIELFKTYKYAVVTVGQIKSNSLRVKLFNLAKDIGYKLPTIISPLAYVSKHSTIGEGTVVLHQALVNSNSKIGRNCIINSKALIEHDVLVEDNCHISTGTIINGGVIIDKNTFVGSNATTKEYIKLNGFIKAGSIQK